MSVVLTLLLQNARKLINHAILRNNARQLNVQVNLLTLANQLEFALMDSVHYALTVKLLRQHVQQTKLVIQQMAIFA